MVLNGIHAVVINSISKYHSGTIVYETGKCTIEDFSDIDGFSIVMNGISKYHSAGYHRDRHT